MYEVYIHFICNICIHEAVCTNIICTSNACELQTKSISLQYRLLSAYIYLNEKIKYYYSFNVNNPVNTCQRLLINYPAARRRHLVRVRVVYSIAYYYTHYYYNIYYTRACIHPIIMVEYLFVIVHFRVLNHAVMIVCESKIIIKKSNNKCANGIAGHVYKICVGTIGVYYIYILYTYYMVYTLYFYSVIICIRQYNNYLNRWWCIHIIIILYYIVFKFRVYYFVYNIRIVLNYFIILGILGTLHNSRFRL